MSNLPPEILRAIAQLRRMGYRVERDGRVLKIAPRRPKRRFRPILPNA
jgi:hypothetical protein